MYCVYLDSYIPCICSSLQEYSIADFRTIVEKQASVSLDQHQFFLGQKPLPDLHQGKKATLGDHGVKHLDTLLVVHVGLSFNITNPKVSMKGTKL